jgi:anti-anti-sigma factor
MPTASPYRLERDQTRTIVTLLPGLNDVPWSDIERIGGDILQRLQEIPSPALLVDLCALNYMGSVQVALVVRMFKAVKERGGKLVVANSDPMVQQVLNIAGLDKLWTTADDRDEGLKLLGGAADAAAGGWQCAVGVAAVAISLVGLFAVTTQAGWLPARSALMIELMAAAVGFVFALWAVLKGEGSRRMIGTGVLLGSVALMLVSAHRAGTSAPGAPPQLASPADQLRETAPPVTALSDGGPSDTDTTPAVPTPLSPAAVGAEPSKPADAAQPDAP